MFGAVKKVLGIEGVKIDLIVADKISKDTGIVSGIIKLTSLSDGNILESITLTMVEKYSRGRGDSRLTNEYPMGELIKREKMSISKNDIIEIPFEMEFVYVKSEMDKMEDNNIFAKGLIKFAKKIRNVSSEFSIKAEAKIKGTTLNPLVSKPINLV